MNYNELYISGLYDSKINNSKSYCIIRVGQPEPPINHIWWPVPVNNDPVRCICATVLSDTSLVGIDASNNLIMRPNLNSNWVTVSSSNRKVKSITALKNDAILGIGLNNELLILETLEGSWMNASYFLLSWTLTQSSGNAILCTLNPLGAKTIIDLAESANDNLSQNLLPALIPQQNFPNIIYIDDFSNGNATAIAMYINLLN